MLKRVGWINRGPSNKFSPVNESKLSLVVFVDAVVISFVAMVFLLSCF